MDCPWRGALWWALAVAMAVPSAARAERTVFLNFDTQAINNASGNEPILDSYSTNGFTPGTVDGFAALSDDDRLELVHWFKEATVPLGIRFVDERPASGSYDMLVFGSAADYSEMFSGLGGCSLAVGLADCADTDLTDISFVFWGCMPDDQQDDLRRVAFYGLTGLGFAWGLENLETSGEIMGSYTLSGLEFGSVCAPISGASGCAHQACLADQQNSSADLMARHGARIDDGPPVVTITSPIDNTVVDPNIRITADVEDAFGGVSVSSTIVEVDQSLADDTPPHEWNISDIPAGTWTLRVTATDADANVSMQEVVVCVGVPACGAMPGSEGSSSGGGTTAADETGGSSGTSNGDVTGTSASESSSGAPQTGGAIDPTVAPASGGFGGAAGTGCGCQHTPTGPTGVFALVGLALGRRRSRRGA